MPQRADTVLKIKMTHLTQRLMVFILIGRQTQDRTSVMKKEATEHCCWGKCRSYLRYLDKSPPGTCVIRFSKPGKIKDTMTELGKGREKRKIEKCRKWVHAF